MRAIYFLIYVSHHISFHSSHFVSFPKNMKTAHIFQKRVVVVLVPVWLFVVVVVVLLVEAADDGSATASLMASRALSGAQAMHSTTWS